MPWAAFRMNSCVHLCVCLCVQPINISTLPDSRSLYVKAVLPSACLALHLLACFIKVHSDHICKGQVGDWRAYSQITVLSHCLLLHQRNSHLGTNLCVVVAKIEELPDWESVRLHSGGNNKSLGLLSR